MCRVLTLPSETADIWSFLELQLVFNPADRVSEGSFVRIASRSWHLMRHGHSVNYLYITCEELINPLRNYPMLIIFKNFMSSFIRDLLFETPSRITRSINDNG
jgi:hypothetical protein